ncbi:hypothetical protein O3M35_011407 [Rhynocoris fuscipes]|uniref:Sulfhydryl oxidase n=1 Tax=Rhynocoris fuscipes TaxID=488301 RepID=A0AAW1CYS0_9HEMI
MEGDLRRSSGNAPCRACTAFKSWANNQTQTSQNQRTQLGVECPLDKEELGRSTWGFLHSMAAYYPEQPSTSQQSKMMDLIQNFSHFYPCEHCAKHLREDLKTSPPNVTSADALSQWFCQMHNRVNVRLGKPVFDCSRVKERWKDGWKDGSCD